MNGSLLKVYVLTAGRYVELAQPWLETVGLGLTLWEGMFETQPGLWLRWCDSEGRVIPTGAERAMLEQQRADQAEARARQLAERLRAMGIDPDEVT